MKKEVVRLRIGDKKVELHLKRGRGVRNILRQIRTGVRRPFEFFSNISSIHFCIELVYSRKEFDKVLGQKTETWVTAHSFGKKFIIFDPSAIERYTSHRRNEFTQIIAHETSHVLLKKLNTAFCIWMNEGLAQYIAGQSPKDSIHLDNRDYFISECLFKNSNYDTFISKQGYEISYRLVQYLLRKYGKKRMMRLLAVRYPFTGSAEKSVCRILHTEKEELIDQCKRVLQNSH